MLGDLADDLAAAALAMARRFAAGGTLWCLAPAWPAHAHHLAVEFVHPVIMGKRALPAVTVPDADPVAALRPLARPGDLLVSVASVSDDRVSRAMRRAPAWGVTTVWIGAGPRPPAGAADHVLWLDGEESAAAFTGGFVLVYHLLWELTHVCFEHPGLLREEDACGEAVCVTCADEAHIGEVSAVDPDGAVWLRTAAGRERADASLVEGVAVGDLLLVHAGTVIECVEGAST